jgi:hypothetical protein
VKVGLNYKWNSEILKENLILPTTNYSDKEEQNKVDFGLTSLVSEWINSRSQFINEVWSKPSIEKKTVSPIDPDEIAREITELLIHRIFNFQSRKNLSQIISNVRQNLSRQINKGTAIKFILLYNGGYRASPFSNQPSLIFEPDQTELMLLYQIALLHKKILPLYAYGIDFHIVINNGVGKWVNDIPITSTENYANQLRKMIHFFGAENSISVVLQSEFVDFDPFFSFEPFKTEQFLSEDEHLIIERFLGRRCSREEAEYRSALYKLAELKWGKDLSPIIASKDGILMRQVAHPDMLSFRPFPGGAIRIQNGTLGFQHKNDVLRPKLITSKSVAEHNVKYVLYHSAWEWDKNVKTTMLKHE